MTDGPGLRLLHVSLLSADLGRSRAFYEGILGLSPSPARPPMQFAGVWYELGAQPGDSQLHILCLPNPDPVQGRPAHGGQDRHTAFGVHDWPALLARLEAAGVPYTRSRSGRAAIFVRDPDGNALELMALNARASLGCARGSGKVA